MTKVNSFKPKDSASQALVRSGSSPGNQKSKQGNQAQGAMRAAYAPVAMAKGQRSGAPRITQSGPRGCRIVHRELVTNVVGTASFTVAGTYPLNPGMAVTFPWLSGEAAGWEQYRWRSLRFCYYTRAATTDRGSVLLVPDYDAADQAPVSEQIASTYENTVEEAPWVEWFCCALDVKSMTEPGDRKFVRSGSLASNLDIKMYDGGNLFLCTTDGAAVNWGKLWVEYDVEFFKPQLNPQGPALNYSAKVVAGGTVSKAAPFGTAPVVTGQLPITVSGNTITFNTPAQVVISWGAGGTVFSGSPTLGGTATSALSAAIYDAAATTAMGSAIVRAVAAGDTFTLDYSAVATTVTSGTYFIGAYAYGN